MASSTAPTWTVACNYWTGRRAHGGRLALGEQHLSFRPHLLERLLGGRAAWEAPLDDITAVVVERRRGHPRTRVFVTTRDGAEAAFLPTGAEQRGADIRRAAGLGG